AWPLSSSETAPASCARTSILLRALNVRLWRAVKGPLKAVLPSAVMVTVVALPATILSCSPPVAGWTVACTGGWPGSGGADEAGAGVEFTTGGAGDPLVPAGAPMEAAPSPPAVPEVEGVDTTCAAADCE